MKLRYLIAGYLIGNVPQRLGRKAWILTQSGRRFYPIAPRAEDVVIEDIAHALANMCRFNGHCSDYYSVAQHSVLVSEAVERALPGDPMAALQGLLHDATEAYLPDVPSPVKPFLFGFKRIENRVMAALCQALHIPQAFPPEIKAADLAILWDEARALLKEPPSDWHVPVIPLGVQISPWEPKKAKRLFMDRFRSLLAQLKYAQAA
ncbi:hypothetical protein [Thioalkalivibrio thiocyanodenitrificans]|uniref:hypothetical protein n=1 Tax=Thioalkalivibrio thiocyanodenitrificans TaxID=243063 RepID=UPI00038082DF|nr:hypothetical protein [Thioalkalivibrio thiocyanodenitrificans]